MGRKQGDSGFYFLVQECGKGNRMKKIIALLCAVMMTVTAIPASAAELETDTVAVEYAAEEGPKMTAFEQALSDYFFNGGEAPKKSELEKIKKLYVYGSVVLADRELKDYFSCEFASIYTYPTKEGGRIFYFSRGESFEESENCPVDVQKTIKTDVIAKMKNLTELEIWAAEVTELSAFRNLTKLKMLQLKGSFEDLSPLKKLTNLRYLTLAGKFRDLSPLENMTKMESLYLVGSFQDLSSLKKMKKLETLVLTGSFRDLSPLKNLKKVGLVDLEGEFDRLSPLGKMTDLFYAILISPNLRQAEEKAFRETHPEMIIFTVNTH